MAGVPVKLTFDPSYPDHARALEILRGQKHTTQFVVNLILGVAPVLTEVAQVTSEQCGSYLQVTEVTAELPASNHNVSTKLPASNLQVTQVTDNTTLADIPADILSFLKEANNE